MQTTVAVASAHAAEDLRQLQGWLLQEPELRGCVRLAEHPPEPGHLGADPGLMSVLLDSGPAAATVLTSAVVAWLRHRTTDVDCTITMPNGRTLTFSAKRVQESDMQAQHELIRDVSAKLADDSVDEPEADKTEAGDGDPKSAP